LLYRTRFRIAAFTSREQMQGLPALVRTGKSLKQFQSSFTKSIQPCAGILGQHSVHFFAQTLRQRRTLASGGYSDLEIPSSHNGWIEEVAVWWIVDRVAEYTPGTRGFGHSMIHGSLIGCRYDKEDALQISTCKLARMPNQFSGASLSIDFWTCLWSNDSNSTSCPQKTRDLGRSNGTRSDHQAAASFKLEEDGEHLHRTQTLTSQHRISRLGIVGRLNGFDAVNPLSLHIAVLFRDE
jgi:hypothetical protein